MWQVACVRCVSMATQKCLCVMLCGVGCLRKNFWKWLVPLSSVRRNSTQVCCIGVLLINHWFGMPYQLLNACVCDFFFFFFIKVYVGNLYSSNAPVTSVRSIFLWHGMKCCICWYYVVKVILELVSCRETGWLWWWGQWWLWQRWLWQWWLWSIIIITEIPKAPTLRLTALNKQIITRTMNIKIENVTSSLTKS